MGTKRAILRFYGNRGMRFDAFISLLISVVLILIFNFSGILVNNSDGFSYSLVEFLGVLAGFLLTSFSLLYLYNPSESEVLSKFRKDKLFLSMLKSFLSTILFTLTSIFLIYLNALVRTGDLFNYVLIFFLTLTSLRILRSVYYLFVIVDIGGNSPSKSD